MSSLAAGYSIDFCRSERFSSRKIEEWNLRYDELAQIHTKIAGLNKRPAIFN